MTAKDIELLMQAIAPVIKEYTEGVVAPLRSRITELNQELAEVKSTKHTLADAYKGVWQPTQFDRYERGSAVTFEGSLWIARAATRAKPGTNDEWQLAVKRGSDGKDLR